MRGAQIPLLAGTLRPTTQVATPGVDVYPVNFGLLASDSSWRNSWSFIVPGKFSPSAYSGLLFVEHDSAYAELYETDGQGHLVTPALGRYDPLGGRATWALVVPGYFGPSGYTGLLLYDRAAGEGFFYDSDGKGGFALRSHYAGWRTSWTHIVSGRFVASSPYSSLFFYSEQENYGEIWATDGTGLAGNNPHQTFADFWQSTFSHVVAGDFHWTPGYITETPTLTDLFFYDAATGHGEMYRSDKSGTGDSSIVVSPSMVSDALPPHATDVVAGSFGGIGNTDLAFYDGSSGTVRFYLFNDVADTAGNDTGAELILRETQSGLRVSATSAMIAGNFWWANSGDPIDPGDHAFSDGPRMTSSPPFDPNFRFSTGAFSSLLFYDRAAGLGEFYFHEPLPPPAEPLEAYITSTSSHNGAPALRTGSVLPGESIAFHVSSQQGNYSITIYRQGGMPGDGNPEQQMATIPGLPTNPTPYAISRTAYKDGAQWPVVATFQVPDWASGLYIARVRTIASPSFTMDVPFVVRARPGSENGVLLVLADTTYTAYNDWGGRNSYGHLTGGDFAGAFPSASAYRIPFGFRLSFDRPQHDGWGNVPQSLEIPFIRWLVLRRIPFDVCTSRDLHFEGPSVNQRRLLLFVGHHEYWTAQMRDHVEAFVKSGGNAAFFCGNTCWWQIRIDADGSTLTCFKVAGLDPVSTTPQHVLTTAHWFDDLVKRPETSLAGVSFYGDGGIFYDADHRFKVNEPSHWAFADTGLTKDATFGGYASQPGGAEDSSVAGVETDHVQRGALPGLTSPAGFADLAAIFDLTNTELEVGTMGTFKPSAGSGVVFTAATTNWAGGLTQGARPTNTIDRITLNVVQKLGLAWKSVSEGSTTRGARVTALAMGNNLVDLFLADPAGGVYTTSGNVDAGWRPWTSVSEGSTRPGATIAAAITAQDRVTLILADPQGGVYATSGSAAQGWRPWSSVSEGSTTPGAPITALATGPNRLAVFLADPGGGVYTTSGSVESGWQPWSSVSEGSTTPGAPIAATMLGGNRIALFLADPAGGIYTTSGTAESGWQPWTSVSQGSSTPGGTLTALADQNMVTLFLADPGGGVYTTSGIPGQRWGPWSSVSQGQTMPGAPIAAVLTTPGRFALFLADPSGEIYAASGNRAQGWGPWTAVRELTTAPGAPISAILTAPDQVTLIVTDVEGEVFATNKVRLA